MYSDCNDSNVPAGPKPDPSFDLVRPCDIKGILHSHSRYTDGAHSLSSMVQTAREIGLEYLGFSDHFQSEAHSDGLDLEAAREQREEINRLLKQFPGFDILQGVEVDAEPDGNLPLDDQTLDLFDYVIVSFPEAGDQDLDRFTMRVTRAAAHSRVAILGNPVGDLILHRQNGVLDMDQVLTAASQAGTAVEINANPTCKDLDWAFCRAAQEMGVFMSISPNAHRAARLVDFRHGAERASEAGLHCASILNTLSSEELRHYWSTGEVRRG